MTSCYNVSQLRPLALCIQGLPLGYRSVSVLAKGEAEGLIYITRSSLKVRNKLPPLRVVVANHHGKKDTRCEFIRTQPVVRANKFAPTSMATAVLGLRPKEKPAALTAGFCALLLRREHCGLALALRAIEAGALPLS